MELVVDNVRDIEAHLRGIGWLGSDEALLALTVPGAGNMNRTLRARLPSRSMILKQAVPYVARYPQIPAPQDRLATEAAFYRAIGAHAGLSRQTPALLGEDPANHLLWLEDLGEGGDLTGLYAGSAPADGVLATLARWLSALHELPVDPARVPDNLAMRQLNHAHIFEVPFDPDNGVDLAPPLRDAQAELAGNTRVRQRAAALGEIYLGTAAHRSRGALLHGDFYPGSWYAAGDRVAVIDPEFAFVGAPEFDVGVMLAHLEMAGLDAPARAAVTAEYRPPPGYDPDLAAAFAAMETVRRLLGVAQLPLQADQTRRLAWLESAATVLGS